MTGNLKLLINFVEKILGTIRCGSEMSSLHQFLDMEIQFKGTLRSNGFTTSKGNFFSVGQFFDADLEVAFRKSTSFVRDLQRNDLLTGICGSGLYTIALQESSFPTLICFMAKASSTQAWLWHRSHLNLTSSTCFEREIF
ncbi:hypothetical protein Tco_0143743 [Tanacetum coccineum]